MRMLNKMKLINWHYFTNESISFDGSSLITGDNGAGKSTLIDALQVVIIANLKKMKFNSSASEEITTRDIRTYLRGKTGTEGHQTYLRNKDFSSYIVLEILHSSTEKPYLIGVAFDYSASSGQEEHTFFKIDEEPLRDDLFFAEPSLPRNRQQFFQHLKARGYRFKQYRNDLTGYIHDLRQLFGGVKESFFPLFQKGISFTPITDLRRFVYDYILEEREIDVDTMREYFEKFREVEKMIGLTQNEITRLEAIKDQYSEIERIKDQQQSGEYMILRANLEEVKHELEQSRKAKDDLAEEITDLKAKQNELKSQKSLIDQRIDKLDEEIRDNQTAIKERHLKERIDLLAQEIKHLKQQQTNLVNQIRVEVKETETLHTLLKDLAAPFKLCELLLESKDKWEQVVDHGVAAFPQDISLCAKSWSQAMQWVSVNKQQWQQEIAAIKEEIAGLEESIADLEKNQVLRNDSSTMKLKRILEEHLHSSSSSHIPVHILCEAVEIKDKTWQNAIEGYLHTQKFDLLVPPGFFDQALELYERHKFSHRLESVGLVNTDKLLQSARAPQPNSLATEVNAQEDYISAYANYLLGGLIKCHSQQELKQYKRAITASCMVYQNHTARQIPKKRYEVPFIGKEAIRFQLAQKKEELSDAEHRLAELKLKITLVNQVVDLSWDKRDRYEQWRGQSQLVSSISTKEDELVDVRNQLMTLDRGELTRLERSKVQAKQERDTVDNQIIAVARKASRHEEKIEGLAEKILRLSNDQELAAKEVADFVQRLADGVVKKLQAKWERESTKKSPVQLALNYTTSTAGLTTRINNLMQGLIRTRTDFVHEFGFSGDPQATDNHEFDSRLALLVESHLQDYQEKAQQAREQAERAFQEHFVAKLRESIELAKEEINELNRALKDMQFGNDSYTFSLSSKSEMRHYYQMITDADLFSGMSLFNQSFLDKHGDTIDLLFKEITNRSEDFQSKMEELTDYRSYLNFEIVITDEKGNKSHFSKVARDKSGGETQVPFYVAILASFYQAYQLYRKKDTLRLVVFDEAFNRMDADRIEEAVEFIKNLGFQALIVAPTGKIQLIVPHVNTNLIVMRDGFASFVERVSRKEIAQWN